MPKSVPHSPSLLSKYSRDGRKRRFQGANSGPTSPFHHILTFVYPTQATLGYSVPPTCKTHSYPRASAHAVLTARHRCKLFVAFTSQVSVTSSDKPILIPLSTVPLPPHMHQCPALFHSITKCPHTSTYHPDTYYYVLICLTLQGLALKEGRDWVCLVLGAYNSAWPRVAL